VSDESAGKGGWKMKRDSKGRFIKTSDTAAITAYKGFDKDLECRNMQYVIGKSYTHNGDVKLCESGFHSCENPLDVLNYYDLCESRFARVTASGTIARHNKQDSKIASASITIDAEIKLPEFIISAVNYLIDLCKSASGSNSQLAASGDNSQLAASGDNSQLAASGDNSQLAASGYYSKLAASGSNSKLAASGYYSKLAASGSNSKLAASGYYSKLAASGDNSIVMCAGIGCFAKVGENGTLVLTRWVSAENRYRVTVAYVGENGIKADTWYKLDGDGKFVENERGLI
jgi:hypothetical protein